MRTITDRDGKVVARLQSEGNHEAIYNRDGCRLGFFDPNSNSTFDRHGRRIGSDDQRMTLLQED